MLERARAWGRSFVFCARPLPRRSCSCAGARRDPGGLVAEIRDHTAENLKRRDAAAAREVR
jgi:hypothetical protein